MIYGLALILMDVAIAHRYGMGTQAAVYQAAYLIPTVIVSILSGGAILGTFIPIFIRLGGQQHKPEAQTFLLTSEGIVVSILTLLVLVMMAMAPYITTLVASGFEPALRDEVTVVMRLMLPMLILHGLACVFGAALTSLGSIGLSNMAPILIPIAALSTYSWWGEQDGAREIAIWYLFGAALFALVTGIRLRRYGYSLFPGRISHTPASQEFLHTYGITALAQAAMSALLLINQSIAGGLSARDLAAFSYGMKLVSLGLAFFTTIFTSVGLPHFSAMANRLDQNEIWFNARSLIRRAFIVTAIIALIWMGITGWLVRIIYVRGEFTELDAVLVARVQRYFVLQAPFYVIGIICWRILNSLSKSKPLVIASLLTLVLDIILTLPLARNFGAPGIAVAHTLAITVWALILLLTLRSQLKSSPLINR
jgi:putative peptidoglycan lipid II flippase